MRVADTVGAVLAAQGVRHAFGVPGGEVLTLIDGLEGAGIRFCLARHETQAALMAAGASVASGAPGLLVTTIGPGLANAVNGIADASQEKVPLIVLSGIIDRPLRGRFTHQVIDHAALLAPLVKAHFEIEPDNTAAVVERAIATALTAPMGPVHIDVSPAVAAEQDIGLPPTSGGCIAIPEVAPPSEAAVEAVAALVSAAKRPLILAGYDAVLAGASEALRVLSERLKAPVITTYKAKGIVPESSPLALGAAGLSPGADAILLDLVKRCDLLLLIGYDPIEMRQPWLAPAPPDKIIELSEVAHRHGMHEAGLHVLGPLQEIADAIAARVTPRNCTWSDGEPATATSALSARNERAGWGPHAIIRILNIRSRPGDIVTVDSGAHRILLSQMWRAEEPLSLLQSAGFCTMAAALPLAIGAAVAEPHRKVTAVMGDGGLEMGLGELATVRDLKLNLAIVVFQDESLALIALKQRASRFDRVGVALGATDFAAVARGFGGHGANVDSVDGLEAALAEADAREGFSLIACHFPEEAYGNAL